MFCMWTTRIELYLFFLTLIRRPSVYCTEVSEDECEWMYSRHYVIHNTPQKGTCAFIETKSLNLKWIWIFEPTNVERAILAIYCNIYCIIYIVYNIYYDVRDRQLCFGAAECAVYYLNQLKTEYIGNVG